MRKKIVLRFLIVILLASAISYLTYIYLERMNRTVVIYVASENIEERSIISEDMIKGVEIGFKEKLRFFDKAFTSKEDLIGLVALRSFQKEDVFFDDIKALVSKSKVNVLKSDGDINDPFFVSYDKRLANVTLDEEDAVGGKVKRGDYVDVAYTSTSGSTGGLYSALILQHVLVYDIIRDGDDYKIYFVLKPEEALTLVLAKKTGSINLLLNPLKGENREILPVTPQQFMNGMNMGNSQAGAGAGAGAGAEEDAAEDKESSEVDSEKSEVENESAAGKGESDE